MKKLLSTILVAAALCSLAGCSDQASTTTASTSPSTTTTTSVTTTTPPTTTTTPLTTTTTPTTTTSVSTPSQEEIDAAISEAAALEQALREQTTTTTAETTPLTTTTTTVETTLAVTTTTTAAVTTWPTGKQSYENIMGEKYTIEYGQEIPDVPKPHDTEGVIELDYAENSTGGHIFYYKNVGSERFIWEYLNGLGWLWCLDAGPGGLIDCSDWENYSGIPGYKFGTTPDGAMDGNHFVSPEGEYITEEEYRRRAKEYWGDLYVEPD